MAYWFLIPAGYQIVAILAALAFLRRKSPGLTALPSVSILKPSLPDTLPLEEALATHQTQTYPHFSLVIGRQTGVRTPNRKVGKLMALAGEATGEVWIVNDADIRVPPDYIADVVATLQQPGVGLATCLFRASGDSMPSRIEGFGVAVDFMPSVLVARLVGIREFGLGATLAFRKADLDRIGGFAAIAEYVADDYHLAKKITKLGLRAELARSVVESTLHGGWREVWTHQVRWARTIRASRASAYLGLPVAHAGLWALFSNDLWIFSGLVALRVLTAWVGGVLVVNSPLAKRWFWLAPLWDLAAFAMWVMGWTGNTVKWQGRTLRLDREGRIVSNT